MASFKYVCLVLAMLTVICIADEQMTENEVKEKPHSSFKPKQLVDLSNGKEGLHTFKQGPNVKVIYFYKRAIPRLRFFMKELEKSAEFLDLYGVKIGYCDCTLDANADIPDCEKTKVENNIYTFRSGNPLLSLELETMFDVNSIMSNILQLVLLREVPILQTPAEVEKFLHKHAGKHDVIFGHMKAIGTFDHRVFMEVAYAYNEKFKFAICTDKTATTLFEEPPLNPGRSSIWWVWTKDDQPKDKVYQSVQYKGDLNLAAFAKFAMMISFPKMFDIPGDGPESPYTLPDVTKIKFYYTKSCKDLVLQRALLVGKHYLDSAHILLINTDEHDVSGMFVEGKREPPVMCIQMPPQSHENCLWDLKTTDRLADFIETSMGRETSRFDDKRNKYMEAKDEGQGEDSSLDGRESLDINIDDVETQDDKIAEAVTKASKIPMSLALVPALTDKTFPETLSNNKIVLTLFYFPFDAVSMANLRMLGDAADRLGVMTPVKVTRVNCHDWTDVCSDQKIIMYPTLRIFKGGEMVWDYKGPQDIQEMYSMMKLLELSPPIKVDDQVDMTNYLMGEGKINVKDFTNTTVVGLFSRVTKQNLNEIQLFKQLVSESRDRILFVYSDDKTVAKMASQFGATIPAVILSKYGDTIQPHVKFEGEFNVKSLKEFVQNNKLPKLPVLTPLMFPELRRRGSDFVILFTDNSVGCQVPEDAVREVVKTQHFNNISFTMLPVEGITSLGFQVLDQYTTDPTVPYLSYVSLNKGEVFNFGNTNFEQERLSKWITSVTERTIEPSTTLKEGEWKPLNKGYEFLKMMDYEQKEAKEKAKQNKKKSLDMDTSMPQQEEDSGEEDRGSIMENDEDTDTRKDLFDLNQSRLYHQAPGRGGDKHHDPASRSGVKEGMKTGVKDSMKKDTGNTHDPSEL